MGYPKLPSINISISISISDPLLYTMVAVLPEEFVDAFVRGLALIMAAAVDELRGADSVHHALGVLFGLIDTSTEAQQTTTWLVTVAAFVCMTNHQCGYVICDSQ